MLVDKDKEIEKIKGIPDKEEEESKAVSEQTSDSGATGNKS